MLPFSWTVLKLIVRYVLHPSFRFNNVHSFFGFFDIFLVVRMFGLPKRADSIVVFGFYVGVRFGGTFLLMLLIFLVPSLNLTLLVKTGTLLVEVKQ